MDDLNGTGSGFHENGIWLRPSEILTPVQVRSARGTKYQHARQQLHQESLVVTVFLTQLRAVPPFPPVFNVGYRQVVCEKCQQLVTDAVRKRTITLFAGLPHVVTRAFWTDVDSMEFSGRYSQGLAFRHGKLASTGCDESERSQRHLQQLL